jgi:hypothetical protein
MKYQVNTHKGVVIDNPSIEIVGTFDNPIEETFTPSIIFAFGENRIFNEMPPQPYINGTWNDSDVDKAIEKHLKSLEI